MRPAFMAEPAMVLIQRLTTLKFGKRRWRNQHQRSTQTHPATKYLDTLSHQPNLSFIVKLESDNPVSSVETSSLVVLQCNRITSCHFPKTHHFTCPEGQKPAMKGDSGTA
jgi:hypothetical protein